MDVEELAPLTFLEPLTPEQREHLAGRCRRVQYPRGERIIAEGATGDQWFGLLSGWVRVTRGAVVLGKLGPGRFFGEMALLGDGRRNASIDADSDCVCAVLGRQDFLDLMQEAPAVAEHVRAVVSARQRQPAPR
jgi:CRP-like cAMP-binding protein